MRQKTYLLGHIGLSLVLQALLRQLTPDAAIAGIRGAIRDPGDVSFWAIVITRAIEASCTFLNAVNGGSLFEAACLVFLARAPLLHVALSYMQLDLNAVALVVITDIVSIVSPLWFLTNAALVPPTRPDSSIQALLTALVSVIVSVFMYIFESRLLRLWIASNYTHIRNLVQTPMPVLFLVNAPVAAAIVFLWRKPSQVLLAILFPLILGAAHLFNLFQAESLMLTLQHTILWSAAIAISYVCIYAVLNS